MTDKDEQLLEQFFAPMRQLEMADDGFTDQLMQRLPQPGPSRSEVYVRLSHFWTAACVCLAVVLFVVLRGWESVQAAIRLLWQTRPDTLSPLTLLLCGALTGCWLLAETLRRERLLG